MPGEAWSVTDPDALIPGIPGTPGTPGDVCPQGWTEDFDRSQMSTEVMINRLQPPVTPRLPYDFVTTTSAPPASGQLRLNNADQTLATAMYVHKLGNGGIDVSIWLRYLIEDSSVRVAVWDDPGTLRGYRIVGAPTEHASYFEFPIQWEDGVDPLPAYGVFLTLSLLAEPPDRWIDTVGRDLYGVETFSRLDLINTSRDLFETLADQILEVRGVNSVPRVDSVTIDARTGQTFPGWNAQLMSSCRPELPSRYRCRLQVPVEGGDPRMVYDRMCFASSIRHLITRDEWTLTIGLDIAEWAAT
jgi:hypothetical protein